MANKLWSSVQKGTYSGATGSTGPTGADGTSSGFAGLFHEYLYVRPLYYYCLRNKMFDLADRYKLMMTEMETAIENYYKSREKDVVKTLIGATNNSR